MSVAGARTITACLNRGVRQAGHVAWHTTPAIGRSWRRREQDNAQVGTRWVSEGVLTGPYTVFYYIILQLTDDSAPDVSSNLFVDIIHLHNNITETY